MAVAKPSSIGSIAGRDFSLSREFLDLSSKSLSSQVGKRKMFREAMARVFRPFSTAVAHLPLPASCRRRPAVRALGGGSFYRPAGVNT